MKRNALPGLGVTIILGILLVASNATAESENLRRLGKFPLCEASSVLIIDCPGGQGDCLIVGDNERKRDLYLFQIKDHAIDSSNQKALSLQLKEKEELSDIEAMVHLSADTIVVFGSYSRKKSCEADKERRRFIEVKLIGNKAEVIRRVKSKKIKCDRLFGPIPEGDEILEAVCDAIDSARNEAKAIEKELDEQIIDKKTAETRCSEIAPFNAEGAVAIEANGGVEVWVGLRAPLLAKHPSQPEHTRLAMLFKMKDLEAYKFDRVVFLDLDGRGVRELFLADDKVWLIAGPAQDKQEPFKLHYFPKEALNSVEIIKPNFVMNLPASSEGLAIKGGRAYVVTDGDKGDDDAAKKCIMPSNYLIVTNPKF